MYLSGSRFPETVLPEDEPAYNPNARGKGPRGPGVRWHPADPQLWAPGTWREPLQRPQAERRRRQHRVRLRHRRLSLRLQPAPPLAQQPLLAARPLLAVRPLLPSRPPLLLVQQNYFSSLHLLHLCGHETVICSDLAS